MKSIIEVAQTAAQSAGDFLKSKFGTTLNIERKPDLSLVTNVDKTAEQMIIDEITRHFPTHSIMGEEQGHSAIGKEYTWIIDPLDGTHNFIHQIPLYGVSIGVARGEDLIAGVIYLPSTDEMYVAEQGSGAQLNGRKITVSTVDKIVHASITFDSGFRNMPEVKTAALRALSQNCFSVRMFGSSARNLTYIADGRLDLVVEFDDHLWDFAAGACIVREAGGKVTDFEGKELKAREGDRYVACAPALHEELMILLKKVLPA